MRSLLRIAPAFVFLFVSSLALAQSAPTTPSVQANPTALPAQPQVQVTPEEQQLQKDHQESIIRAAQLAHVVMMLRLGSYFHGKTQDIDAMYDAMYKALWDFIGDKHADYFGPTEWKEFQDAVGPNQNVVGIGASLISDEQHHVEILRVIPKGAAEAAGLLNGDKIIAVDGWTIPDNTPLDKVVSKIRGQSGTPVVLQIQRGSVTTITVTRKAIQFQHVYVIKHGDILEVRLDSFSENAYDDMKAAIADALGSGDAQPKAIVLDLRENGGGLLTQAGAIYSLFGKYKDKIVTTKDYQNEADQELSSGNPNPWTCPLIVLIDRNSASASEILSGALKDNGRAVIMGEHSYKKGSVQGTFPLDQKGTTWVKFTIDHFFVGKDEVPIDGIGVEPDINVKRVAPFKPESREYTLYLARAFERGDIQHDSVLKAAVDYLKQHYPSLRTTN